MSMPMPDQDNPRILLVDDDKQLTFILRAHLNAIGYVVEEAHDAEAGLRLLPEFKPDLVVMDLTLPGMNGIEATQSLKNNPETADISVVMLTARNDSDHVVMALEAGAQEYVVKPFEVAELLARIRTVLRLRQTKQELDNLNSRLRVEIEQRTGRLRTLYNYTRALNEADSRDQVLDLVIETVRKVTGSQRVSILLKDSDVRHLVCARATGIEDQVAKSIRIAVHDGIAGQVFSSGKTYVANTYNHDHAEGNRYDGDSFVSTPLIATTLMTREEILGVLSITDKPDGGFTPEEIECIRSVADSGAIALHNQMRRERLSESVDALLMTVGRLAEFRDNETSNHLERVCTFSRILATELQRDSKYSDIVTDKFIDDLSRAAPMHDIGKVGIADQILCKPGKLTPEEFDEMKQHCRIGREVLESALDKTGPVPILTMCVEIASHHHERFDGNGYPDQLVGEKIPLSARIIALVDAYDAITSRRRYKDPMSHARAVDIIESEAGKHFDPDLVAPFLRCAKEFDSIRAEHADASMEMEESPIAQPSLTT